MLEAIPGTAGIMVPPPGYLAGVREICDRHGIVLIADEVMSGFGRSGRWFAVEHGDITPDLVTFAKGVNSGYVPLGGVAISDEIYATFAHRTYPGGLTYSGHPLACAAAVATIRTMEDEDVVGRAARLGEDVLGPGLRALAERHDWIGEVRGTGAFWAIELVSDRATREPLAPYGGSSPEMAAIVKGCQERGMLPFSQLQPHPRRPAAHHHRRRGPRGPGDPRRRAHRRGRLTRPRPVAAHRTAYERHAPDPRLVERSLADSRQAVFWLEDVGPRAHATPSSPRRRGPT